MFASLVRNKPRFLQCVCFTVLCLVLTDTYVVHVMCEGINYVNATLGSLPILEWRGEKHLKKVRFGTGSLF